MATTTTAVNACGAKIQLDDKDGALQDISGSSVAGNIELTTKLGDYKVFADGCTYRLACGKDGSISLTIVYTTDDSEGIGILKEWWDADYDDARSIQIDIPTGAGGDDSYTAEVYLESLSIPLTADEASPIMVAAEFKPNGCIDISQIAS